MTYQIRFDVSNFHKFRSLFPGAAKYDKATITFKHTHDFEDKIGNLRKQKSKFLNKTIRAVKRDIKNLTEGKREIERKLDENIITVSLNTFLIGEFEREINNDQLLLCEIYQAARFINEHN